MVRGLPRRTDDLLVTLVTDQEDVVTLAVEPPCLRVHLCHQWTRRVDRAKRSLCRLLVHDGSDAMRRKDDHGAFWHLVGLLDEHRAEAFEPPYDVGVVHDLFADIDRGPVALQRTLYGQDRTVDAGAVAAG